MAKIKVGDRVQMPGVPFVVEVLEVGDCNDDACPTVEEGDGETFRFKDPQSGEDDWEHSAEFELVPVVEVWVDEAADVLSEEACEQRMQEITAASRKQRV